MPWEAILGGATGAVAVAIVVGVLFLKSLTDKVVEAAEQRFESVSKRAEELHKSALVMASMVDTDLRSRRIDAYCELWKKTGTLPQWPRDRELTYQGLRILTADLRKRYFEVGGMFLSKRARVAYGTVQKCLTAVLEKSQDAKVNDLDYDAILGKCHALRKELTRDLLSRREAPEL